MIQLAKLYHEIVGWGRPVTAHSNLTGLPSLHSLLLSGLVNTGASDFPRIQTGLAHSTAKHITVH